MARPTGISSKVETSRSPKTVIATVLGIGVAVITKTCGGVSLFARRASRCSTPNLCCSSTTMSAKSSNSTPSLSSAWVPIMIPLSPEAINCNAFDFSWAVSEPVKSVTRVPSVDPPSIPFSASGPSKELKFRKCCWASTSVGARRAACAPQSTIANIDRKAMMVFPEPTSP